MASCNASRRSSARSCWRTACRHLRPLTSHRGVDRYAQAHADRGDDRRQRHPISFLLHVRSALILILTLPLGVLLAFIPMAYQGSTANIMSSVASPSRSAPWSMPRSSSSRTFTRSSTIGSAKGRPGDRFAVIVSASRRSGRRSSSRCSSSRCRLFPCSRSKPPRSSVQAARVHEDLFDGLRRRARGDTNARARSHPRGKMRGEEHHFINRWLTRAYAPVVRFVVTHRRSVVVAAALAIAFTVPAFFRLGKEFIRHSTRACCCTCRQPHRACRSPKRRTCSSEWIAS